MQRKERILAQSDRLEEVIEKKIDYIETLCIEINDLVDERDNLMKEVDEAIMTQRINKRRT